MYVGPPKRKAGRPSSKISEIPASIASVPATGVSVDAPITTPAEPSLLTYLANLSTSAQNAALISLLGSIDGQHASEPNPALVDALRQLLSSHPQIGSDPLPATSVAAPRSNASRPWSDDDIVVLDKENVNPSAFKRREDNKPSDAGQNRSSRPLGNMQNSPSSDTSGVLRKRTLSEFMDERDREHAASRNWTNGTADASRPSHHSLATGNQPTRMSRSASIPRQGPQDENTGPRTGRSGPATSPIRPLRRHIPDWARTTTATQPRFSKETEEHLKRKAAEVKQKKKNAKKERQPTGPSASVARRPAERGHEPLKDDPNPQSGAPHRITQSSRAKHLEPGVAAASSSLPIFASDLTLPPSSPPPSSPIRVLPETPIRRNIQRSPTAYGGTPEQSSLFTPTPKLWLSNPRNPGNSQGIPVSPLSSPRFLSGQEGRATRRLERKLEMISGEDGESDASLEVEAPSSSLPIASSDFEFERPVGDGEMTDCEPGFQHWAGLPPSSPPPPTSPILAPLDYCTNELTNDNDINDHTSEVEPPSTGEDIPMSFEDFGRILAVEPDNLAEILAQFSGGNSGGTLVAPPQPDGTGITASSDDYLVEFDFAEFWQSVKPMISLQDTSNSQGGSPALDMGEMDHSKLADQVHALFSGCLM